MKPTYNCKNSRECKRLESAVRELRKYLVGVPDGTETTAEIGTYDDEYKGWVLVGLKMPMSKFENLRLAGAPSVGKDCGAFLLETRNNKFVIQGA
jgi:hypothetical protein